jgi:murein L,D-transpeptidase YcbB/YkuD
MSRKLYICVLKFPGHYILYRFFALVFLGVLVVFSGCHRSSKKKVKDQYDQQNISKLLRQELLHLKTDTGYTHYYDTLSLYYGQHAYQPVWITIMPDSVLISELRSLSDSLVFDGLKREHYQLDSIAGMIAKLSPGPAMDSLAAVIDLRISNALLTLWHDKVMGRTDPRLVIGGKYTLPYPNHPAFNVFDVLKQQQGIDKVAAYAPAHPDYGKLRHLLEKAFRETQGSETMIDTVGVRKLMPGDTSSIVPKLAVRLVELGLAPDSFVGHYRDSLVYSRALVLRIVEIQKTSNLTDDGIIGKTTLKLLNASRNDKIAEIRANMERIRWFGIEPSKPYVRVNLPEFILYIYYPDSVKTMPVCIGKGKEKYFDQKTKKYKESKSYLDRPLNHETPQVFSNIDFVILNPTWTVPSSIVGREMYNLIVKNPGYLAKHNFQVLKNKKVIDPYSINWKQLSPGNIPYTIRQNSGDDNSLGKVKFTFKNPFDVYLHDTPLKGKFKLNNRAVSHGCVRVQDPVSFTGFVLQGNTRVTYDDILIKMGYAPLDTARARQWSEDTASYKLAVKTTYPVRLENRMTVFFDYRTIVFDSYNRPRFIFDVYEKNRLIVEAMDKP